MNRFREWWKAFWTWLKSLTPGGRGRLTEQALSLGFTLGQVAMLETIAKMNRDERRQFMRELTRKKSPIEVLPEDQRIIVP